MDLHPADSASFIRPTSEEVHQDSSPIALISAELLILILDIVRDSFDEPVEDLVLRTKLPIVASHVSKFWRSVALENALWWSDIMITHPWTEEAVEASLQRSKQCLLDISFVGPDTQNESRSSLLPMSEDYQRLLDLLFPHFPRCRALDIRNVFDEGNNIPFSFLEKFHGAEMPCLEKLIFEGEPTYYERFLLHWRSKSLFASTPLLRDLRLIGVGIDQFRVPPISPSVDSISLTSLHLSKISVGSSKIAYSELKESLEACPSLHTLAIYADVLNEWPGLSTSCSVPSLENLYILSNMLTVSQLLIFLSAPKLKELVIAPAIIHDLSLLLSESKKTNNPSQHRFPALKSLTLAPGYYEAFEVVDHASACFPQIECLILANLYVVPFIESFTELSDDAVHASRVLFPNLLDLALTGVDETIVKTIHDVQVFRTQHHLPLRTVYLDSASFEKLKIHRDTGDNSNMGEDEYNQLGVELVEANMWETLRRKFLHSEKRDIFLGAGTYSFHQTSLIRDGA